MRRHTLIWLVALAAAVQLLVPARAVAQQKPAAASNTPAAAPQAPAAAQQPKRPNILVLFGDDIGMWNVDIYLARKHLPYIRNTTKTAYVNDTANISLSVPPPLKLPYPHLPKTKKALLQKCFLKHFRQ